MKKRLENGWILIAIHDTGCGIPEETRLKIPDLFFNSNDVGAGHGPGLATGREISSRHGGKLALASEFDMGTTLSISIRWF